MPAAMQHHAQQSGHSEDGADALMSLLGSPIASARDHTMLIIIR